ncbi:MAG: hypothetical protein ACJ761_04810 [Chloroflexota bacterium]
MRRLFALLALAGSLFWLAVAPAAFAAAPANAGCWGTVTSQRAVALHDIGEHTSSFAGSPRLGLANVARLVLGGDATVGDLGAVLATLDEIPETHCP